MSSKRQQLYAMISMVIASGLFGLSFMFIKQSVSSVPAFSLLAWRFTIAAVGLGVCARFGIIKLDLKSKLDKKTLMPLLGLMLFMPIGYYIAEAYGISLTTASESGTVLACVPIVTLLLSAVILKEVPTRLQFFGIIASVAGVVSIVLSKGISASLNIWGYFFLVVSLFCDSLFVIFVYKAKAYTSHEKTFVIAASGAVVFMLIALLENAFSGTIAEFILLPFTNMDFLLSVLYLAVACSIFAFLLYTKSIAVLSANRSVSFAGITTLVSVFAGVFFLNEPFTLIQGIGTVFVLLGVYLANYQPANDLNAKDASVIND